MDIKASNKLVALVAVASLAFSGVSAIAGVARNDSKADQAKSQRCKKNQERKKKCQVAPTGFVPGRVIELTYQGPAIGGADTPAINPWGLIAPVNFIPGIDETLATIEIVDDNSPKASAGFSYDSDGDGLNDTGIDVCGSTPDPIEVLPGTQYNVFPYLLPSTGCTDGVATSGKIIVTFNKV